MRDNTLHFAMTGKPGLAGRKGLRLEVAGLSWGLPRVGCEWEGQRKKKSNLSQEEHSESPELDVDMMGSLIQVRLCKSWPAADQAAVSMV